MPMKAIIGVTARPIHSRVRKVFQSAHSLAVILELTKRMIARCAKNKGTWKNHVKRASLLKKWNLNNNHWGILRNVITAKVK